MNSWIALIDKRFYKIKQATFVLCILSTTVIWKTPLRSLLKTWSDLLMGEKPNLERCQSLKTLNPPLITNTIIIFGMHLISGIFNRIVQKTRHYIIYETY